MPDIDKAVKTLESILDADIYEDWLSEEDRQNVCNVIVLLKEQEAIEPYVDSEGTCSCGNCGETVGYYPVRGSIPEKLCKHCPECGKEVKWDA